MLRMVWPALFLAYAAATFIHIAWVMLHEPYYFDAWNVAVTTHAKPFSVGNLFEFWGHEYTHSNPRLGQPLTYLAYKLVYFAPIASPLAFLALATAVVILGTGRRPRLDLTAIAIGSLWFALPQLGKTLFCSAYSCNYVYTAAIQLWFLVPLRLGVDKKWAPLYLVAGLVAGICNEHTGPTLALFLALYAWHKRDRLALFGLIGVVVGFAALFFAPGQGQRYDGLANRTGMVGRVIQRGLEGNLDILRSLVVYAAPLLVILAIVIMVSRERERLREPLRFVALALAAGTLIALTIFVSPKLGPRFYYVSMALLLAGVIGVVDVALAPRQRIPLIVLAVLASGYAAYKTIPLYAKLHAGSRERMAELAATPRGSVYVADAWKQTDEDWWTLGDDFRDAKKRELVATYFDLTGVAFRAYDPDVPLGITGAHLVAHTTPAYDVGLALGSFKGFDLVGLQRETKIAVELLRQRLAPRPLESVDLVVELDDPEAKLPKRTLVGRWRPERLEGHIGQLARPGGGRMRKVVVPKTLAAAEVYVYNVGGEARRLGPELTYVPWTSGVYWVLACGAAECWVIAATRH